MKQSPSWDLVALSLASSNGPTTRSTATRHPPISTEARLARATRFSRAAAVPWPPGATRRQLIISNGWRAGERYAWIIANGAQLVAVYRTDTRDEFDDLLRYFTHELVFAAAGSAGAFVTWAIGAVKSPLPPPPPEGSGFPAYYVDEVMAAAWQLDATSRP